MKMIKNMKIFVICCLLFESIIINASGDDLKRKPLVHSIAEAEAAFGQLLDFFSMTQAFYPVSCSGIEYKNGVFIKLFGSETRASYIGLESSSQGSFCLYDHGSKRVSFPELLDENRFNYEICPVVAAVVNSLSLPGLNELSSFEGFSRIGNGSRYFVHRDKKRISFHER